MSNNVSAIFTVILFWAAIMVVAACVAWVYFKYVRLNDAMARKIEIVGYYLLFVLIIWEFYVKNILLQELYAYDSYIIEKKINILFKAVYNSFWGEDINKLYPEFMEVGSKFGQAECQLLCVDAIECVMQLVSTVCIAIGRFQDIQSKKNSIK